MVRTYVCLERDGFPEKLSRIVIAARLSSIVILAGCTELL
jgi:hypothetical protein